LLTHHKNIFIIFTILIIQLLSIILQKIFHIFHDLFFSEINILFFNEKLFFVFIFFRINTLGSVNLSD